MTNALKYVVCCETLGFEESFQGSYLGHAFFKACQYGTTMEKMCKHFKEMSISCAELDLQKYVT